MPVETLQTLDNIETNSGSCRPLRNKLLEELELNILQDKAPKGSSVSQASLSPVKKITFASTAEEELSQELRDHGAPEMFMEVIEELNKPMKTPITSTQGSPKQ